MTRLIEIEKEIKKLNNSFNLGETNEDEEFVLFNFCLQAEKKGILEGIEMVEEMLKQGDFYCSENCNSKYWILEEIKELKK